MKKIIIVLSLLALSFCTFGCGGGAGSSNSPAGENPGTPSIVQLLPSHYIAQTNSVIIVHAKVLDGNGDPVRHVPVRFTNMSPVGVLSATSDKTNDMGIATVTLKSTVEGFSTIQAEVNKGVAIVRDKKTVYFSTSLNLVPFMYLDVDGDNDEVYNETSDVNLFETATDNQVVVRATVFNRFGQRTAFTGVTFGSDSSEASFPLGSSATTDADGEAFVLVQVDPVAIRNLGTVLNITADADNGAVNMVSLFLQPVIVSDVNVSANPSVVAPGDTSAITTSVVLNTGHPAPDGTAVSFITSCGTITPFAQTTGGVAEAEFTGSSTEGTCTITATSVGVSDTVDVLVTTDLTVLPSTVSVNGATGGTATFTIYSGVPGYTITSSSSTILPVPASVAASGGTFTVTVPAGTAAGTVTLTVRDSAGTTKTATLTITAGPALSVQPSTVTVDGTAPADTITFTIYGGIPGYTITSNSVTILPVPATVAASGGTFTVTVPAGTPAGSVTITVRDSAGTTATATITITAIALTVQPPSATVAPLGSAGYTIIGGTGPYTVVTSHPAVTAISAVTPTATGGTFTVSNTFVCGADTTVTITVIDNVGATKTADYKIDCP